MLIRTNLKSVIANLEKFQAGLPGAVRAALAPPRWKALLQNSAQQVLQGLVASDDDPLERGALIPPIVDSLVATVTGDRTHFEMHFTSSAAHGFPVDLERARQFALTGGLDTGGDFVSAEENLKAAMDAVRDWVYAEKDLTQHETQDPESAVMAIWEILGLVRRADSDYTPEMAAASADLLRHIAPFVARGGSAGKGVGGGLDAATARQWAQAVLVTWRALVAVELPGRLRAELSALVRRSQGFVLKLEG